MSRRSGTVRVRESDELCLDVPPGWSDSLTTIPWPRALAIAVTWLLGLTLIAASCYQMVSRPTAARVSTMPPLPTGWPATLQLGMSDGLGGAGRMRSSAPFGLRYQYLAGGANTGGGWATWMPDNGFVGAYVRESAEQGMLPVFTYYMLTQSAPGRGSGPNEPDAVRANVADQETMRAYFQDLGLFFQQAAKFPNQTIVLHVEPDLWGFLHQQARDDDARTVPVLVGSTGLPELAGLPDDLSGFAQAVVQLRDRTAPNVLLGYHVSAWATGRDPFMIDAWNRTVDRFALRSARFYASLGVDFDLTFSECSDRDAGFKERIYHDGGRSWWDDGDFARHARFLANYAEQTGHRIVLWQLPYGNTKMRTLDNSWGHFQDNRVEWLLDDPSDAHLRQYLDAGVIGLLFGRGADGATDASDASRDGVTDPEPTDGNARPSLSADDDGGYFRERAAAYYAQGALALP